MNSQSLARGLAFFSLGLGLAELLAPRQVSRVIGVEDDNDNLLRFLGNELRIPLVGVGTREAYLAIRSDDQLENRFEPMLLPPWEANEDCCSLLASFAASLPLRRPSPIATLDMARYLLTRSEGTIGELAHLLVAAAVAAVESGEEAINHRTLSMADYIGPSERRRQFERELM